MNVYILSNILSYIILFNVFIIDLGNKNHDNYNIEMCCEDNTVSEIET